MPQAVGYQYQRHILAIQARALLEFEGKKYESFQTLIGDLERALPAACKISVTKQEILNVVLFH